MTMSPFKAPKMVTEPVGIVKLGLNFLSMILAWLTKKVDSCAKEMERAIVVAHIGKILRKLLNSST